MWGYDMKDPLHDDITCAKTNRAFGDAVRGTHRDGGSLAGWQIILLDVDGFHRMNLAFGFAAGDDILAHVAERLAAALPADGALFRVSVDEFGVFLPPRSTPVMDTAAVLSNAVFADGAPYVGSVSVSVGAAVGADRHNPTELVREAGAALYVARQRKPGRIVDAADITYVYGVAEQEELAVRTALRLGEYVRYYLPLVELPSRRPTAVEMLVRWQQSDMSLRSPATFLPVVQRSGLASEFGALMFACACNDWADTLRDVFVRPQGHDRPVLAVNIDQEQTRQEGFSGLFLHLLSRAGLETDELVLEVTERVFESPTIVTELQALRDAGVMISLDDFGLGSVMLAQLTTLPIDWIKIDQELVGSLDTYDPDMSLIQDIKQLAGLLGVGVAVEGVETETLLSRLIELGITIAQGFLFGQPDTAANIRHWLSEHQTARPVNVAPVQPS
jgi:diguanylate cyclase (GGDEF)-like protein